MTGMEGAVNDRDVSGCTAVVTGAANGIGRALAEEAARRGMTVVAIDSAAAALAATVGELHRAGASVRGEVIDVRDEGALRVLAADIGTATLLFANAGLLRGGSMLKQTAADAQLMLDVNVMGVLHTLRAFAPAMIAASGPKHIVITGSQASFATFPELGTYSASKHAVLAIADALRAELQTARATTTVSLLAPGAVASDIFRAGNFAPRSAGIDPADAARAAFAGALRGDFVISTHDDLDELVSRRLARFSSPEERA